MRPLKSLNTAKNGLWKAVDVVLPPRCVVTGEIVDRQGMIAPQVWAGLNFISDPVCGCCGFPFEFEVDKESLCARCLAERPVFASARAALVYDDQSRSLLLRFKHGDQTHTVATFLPWLKRAGAGILEQADVLVPVPLHRFRLLQRRYNQAALIASALAKDCGLPWLPLALRRDRSTPSQGHLGFRERQKNVKGAFSVHPRSLPHVQGKTIVLVDDVFTTGSTASECAKVLLKAGAKDVHVLAVARVVRSVAVV